MPSPIYCFIQGSANLKAQHSGDFVKTCVGGGGDGGGVGDGGGGGGGSGAGGAFSEALRRTVAVSVMAVPLQLPGSSVKLI